MKLIKTHGEDPTFFQKILQWSVVGVLVSTMAVVFYANWFYPHGNFYPTGDVICENDDRGPCHEQYKEDLRYVSIPKWVKTVRQNQSGAMLLIFASGIFTVVSYVGLDKKQKS
ncbi:MAG: hypothetical protein PHC53_02700 [Patescibacteria group bacterium]|nr:hypothetical protein [Patescibacteria group bacterium]